MYKDKMLSYLPKYERASNTIKDILETIDIELKKENSSIEDLEIQLSVDTATWALDIYEYELGIKTIKNKSYEERRSVIKSKYRGFGKVDNSMLKTVCDSWTNGDVDITFDGKINIKFNSVYGVPNNINDLKAALEEIKPAHLRIIYKFAYLLIKDIHNKKTIKDLMNTKLKLFAGGAVNE